MDKTYTWAGVSRRQGIMIFRIGNSDRTKIFIKDNNTDIQYQELPQAMTEGAALAYIKSLPEFQKGPALECWANIDKGIHKVNQVEKATGTAKAAKKAKAPKAPRVIPIPGGKQVLESMDAERPLITDKTLEEIRDANAARLQRKAYRGQAEGAEGGFTPEEAQDAVDLVNDPEALDAAIEANYAPQHEPEVLEANVKAQAPAKKTRKPLTQEQKDKANARKRELRAAAKKI